MKSLDLKGVWGLIYDFTIIDKIGGIMLLALSIVAIFLGLLGVEVRVGWIGWAVVFMGIGGYSYGLYSILWHWWQPKGNK